MSIRKITWCLAAGLVLAACAAMPVQAQVPASNGGGTSYRSYIELTSEGGNSWTLGSSGNPIDVILDPNAGPWIKTLMGFGGGVVNADDTGYVWPSMYWYTETIHVGGNLSWTDWHEDIATPGWYIGLLSVTLLDGSVPSGLTWEYTESDWPNHGGGLDIFFDPLTPCHTLVIQKQLFWIGDPGVQGDLFSGVIVMNQYPTPEPATLGLLAVGGLGLVLRRRSSAGGRRR